MSDEVTHAGRSYIPPGQILLTETAPLHSALHAAATRAIPEASTSTTEESERRSMSILEIGSAARKERKMKRKKADPRFFISRECYVRPNTDSGVSLSSFPSPTSPYYYCRHCCSLHKDEDGAA